MPPATLPKSSTPISALSSVATNNTTMAVQSGPYTKTQFQSTMEGSRTIKSSKEVEQLLRDYPAALELYRTGKYKVKVKCEADVERVILVEKRSPKVASNNSSAANDVNEANQTVPDVSTTTEPDNEMKKERTPRCSRSPTQYQDRVAPTTTSVSQSGNIVHTTISSIRMTSNTQPKVDHQRTHSKERETSVTPQQKPSTNHRSHSRESQRKASYSKQQGNKINREYPKMMIPYVPNANNPANVWQQQRPVQPYFSNPLLQQQRSSLFMTPSFVPQQNPIYRQPFYFGQQPSAHVVYQQSQQQPTYPPLSVSTVGKTKLHSTHNYSTSSRSASNTMGLPPSFRTFHSNQQQHATLRPMYQPQVPFPFNAAWTNMVNPAMANMMPNNNNNNMYADPKRGARDRARSVDTGGRNNPSMRFPNMFQQQQQQQQQQQPPQLQPPVPMMEPKVHHHHHQHHRHRSHHTGQSVASNKEQNITSKEQPPVGVGEKLTVRQLNDIFMQMDPSGRLPYSSIPAVLQRFSIMLAENDVTSAAKELGYNLNETLSARRLVHILVKLGKITKSNQQQQQQPRQPVSPSMLPEDREVTDIMTQRKAKATHSESSTQPNQWN